MGALDGKHIRIRCSNENRCLYHNRKAFFSLVMLAACGANYYFITFGVGLYGSNNTIGVVIKSQAGK